MSADRVTRGFLPHWYRPGHAHFITYRLADSIPAHKLQEWRVRREWAIERGPQTGAARCEHRQRVHKQYFAEYDRYLDQATDRRWLTDPHVAEMVRENLYHHQGSKYELLAWCIMSNHVHVVLQPFEVQGRANWFADAGSISHAADAASIGDDSAGGEVADGRSPLSAIMHSLKSYTANRANELLGRSGRFWQPESFDHWIRDLEELERIVAYVVRNPVEAGLCAQGVEWRFSSAFDRFQQDGSDCGLVGWLRDDWRTTAAR